MLLLLRKFWHHNCIGVDKLDLLESIHSHVHIEFVMNVSQFVFV